MKMLMPLAFGLCIALFAPSLYAQEQSVHIIGIDHDEPGFSDTLIIRLKGSDKILLTGSNMKQMVKYNKADSLKLLFLSDWEKAVKGKTLSAEAEQVYYFVDHSGKRRLKAENPEYNDKKIDVAEELKRLRLDLPRYEYHIYDLASGYVLNVYVSDPSQLATTLGSVNLTAAIHAADGKKVGAKHYYKVEMDAADQAYKVTDKTRGQFATIELTPCFGAGIIGNTIAPVFGADLNFRFTDKYSTGKIKAGLGYSVFPFVQMNNGEIAKVSFVRNIDLHFLMNVNSGTRSKASWLGLQGGIMNSEDMETFKGAVKFGLMYEGAGPFNYSFDYIVGKHDSFYGLTLKLPF